VRLVATVSFLFMLLLLSSLAFAQVQYYGVDAILDESGRSEIKLTITFFEPEPNFEFSILGKIEKFNASSTAGPVDCSLVTSGISFVTCKLNLTQDKRTVEINFETNDFVRTIEDKYYFDADLGLGRKISSIFVSVRLPEGMALVSEYVKGEISYPENATIVSDGRHHIVTWKLSDIQPGQSLRFQILYEKVEALLPSQILLYGGIFIVAAASVTTFIYLKYFRKPEKLILSVLDDFERSVMDVIVSAGGTINQKKVVQATNLSKAKVSRVVKSLTNRGLIEVERLGRTNKIKIIKKKFKFF